MSETPPSRHALRVADLSGKSPRQFEIVPDADTLKTIARELDVLALKKVRFTGTVTPFAQRDWQMTGQLGATVTQPCSVTLEPVTTRIDVPVNRRFLHDFDDPDGLEAEMPEDDTAEALGTWIDPEAIMAEALSLALPDYPRAPGTELGEVVHTEPGKTPLRESDLKPFAQLAALKAKLDEKP